jgi:hypothetical protein
MMLAVAWFLLDIRFVYTERLDINMRAFAFFFVMGIVALNRLRADREATDSGVYLVGMIFAVGMFTVVTQLRGGGLAGGVMTSMLPSLCFNIGVVAILWKVTDRLTRDCCVDASARYGEVGILRGVQGPARRATAEPELGKALPRRHPLFASSPFHQFSSPSASDFAGRRPHGVGGGVRGRLHRRHALLLMLSSYRASGSIASAAPSPSTSIAAFWLGQQPHGGPRCLSRGSGVPTVPTAGHI